MLARQAWAAGEARGAAPPMLGLAEPCARGGGRRGLAHLSFFIIGILLLREANYRDLRIEH